jgi:hypothetical protein
VLIEQWRRRHYNAIRRHSSAIARRHLRRFCRQRLSALRCAPASPDADHERPDSKLNAWHRFEGQTKQTNFGPPVYLSCALIAIQSETNSLNSKSLLLRAV